MSVIGARSVAANPGWQAPRTTNYRQRRERIGWNHIRFAEIAGDYSY